MYSSEHEESGRHFTLSISGIGKGISSFIFVRINILFLEYYFYQFVVAKYSFYQQLELIISSF